MLHFGVMFSAPVSRWDIAEKMCLTVALWSEQTLTVWVLLGKTSSFASCLGLGCGFLGRKKQERLLASGAGEGCCMRPGAARKERKRQTSVGPPCCSFFWGCGGRKALSALNATLTWMAGDFGGCEDQRQLLGFACAGICVACGPSVKVAVLNMILILSGCWGRAGAGIQAVLLSLSLPSLLEAPYPICQAGPPTTITAGMQPATSPVVAPPKSQIGICSWLVYTSSN